MQLMELLAPQKDTIRLHLVGHSAGAIVHAYLADWLIAQGWSIASASFLAPAATIELFDSRIQPHLQSGKLGRYVQFHLQDALERAEGDAMRLLLGYKRSLLYLVSNALEEEARVPVLGMAKFFDATVAPRNLPHLQYRVAPSSLATGGTKHGNIDDDGKTQASVLAHIQGKPIPAP
jgi:pimeloyl-ACP methyl ester carboxylesterase